MNESVTNNSLQEFQVICKCSKSFTKRTIRIEDTVSKLDFILSITQEGTNICGIVDHEIMEKVWDQADSIYYRDKNKVSYTTNSGEINKSFFMRLLIEAGIPCKSNNMNAHHINGNFLDQRVVNGIFLSRDFHYKLHHALKGCLPTNYDVFIGKVEAVNDPFLTACYVNQKRQIMFEHLELFQAQLNVINAFFKSTDRFSKICNAIHEITDNQRTKEIHFTLPK